MNTDPTRKIGEPQLGLNTVAVVERSPTGIALLGQNVVRIATVVVGLAAVGLGIFPLFLPQPWAVTGAAVCAAIVGLGATLGIASPGVRSQPGAAPVVEAIRVTRVGPEL